MRRRTAKTTSAVNPGIGLENQGKRVFLVDAGPQGDLTTALGWTDADSLDVTLATQMERVICDEPSDCHLMSRNLTPEQRADILMNGTVRM